MTNTDSILAERAATHGDFKDHAQITQDLKRVLHSSRNWIHLPATHKESLEMIVHKMGRALAGDFNYADHYTDMQGYARLVEQIIEGAAAENEAARDIADMAKKFAPRGLTPAMAPTPIKPETPRGDRPLVPFNLPGKADAPVDYAPRDR